MAYWVSKAVLDVYSRAKLLGNIASPRTGMTTGDNNVFCACGLKLKFLRLSLMLKMLTMQEPPGKMVPLTGKGGAICVGMDITSIWSTGKMTVLR